MWQPSAPLDHLRLRARILKSIRDFFAARGVMEVETPLLCRTSVTDPYIHSIPAQFQSYSGNITEQLYLQTSPEYAMKRLLAASSGPIYQICKAFRQGDLGRQHNPEFTLLEWYRPGFTHHALMDEMDALLQLTLQTSAADKKSYREIFHHHLSIDPHTAALDELTRCAAKHNIQIEGEITDRDTWLQLLMSHCIEPALGNEKPCFIYDFPKSQAALSKIIPGNPPVAARFEVYYRGVELANGFHELQDANEQRRRFEQNNVLRQQSGLPEMLIDENLLAALTHGLPDCAGVALGIDRLIMLAAGSNHLADTISFDFSRV